MRMKIIELMLLAFVLSACAPAVVSVPVVAQPPSDLPTAQHVEELIAAGGTAVNHDGTPSRSIYTQGQTGKASFEEFVSPDELSGNGAVFEKIVNFEGLKGRQGQFVYFTKNMTGQVTVYTVGFFKNPDVVKYTSTTVSQLNMFQVKGDMGVAQENIIAWCQKKIENVKTACFHP